MCNLSQGVWEKGVEKGCEEGIQELVLSLQKFLKDQALVAKEVAEQFGLTQETAMKKCSTILEKLMLANQGFFGTPGLIFPALI